MPKNGPKRKKIDSIAEQARVAANAKKPILPPDSVPMSAEEMVFFANILNEAAREEWTPHKLEIAAQMAKKMRRVVEEDALLDAEGTVIENRFGDRVPNPRVGVIKGLTNDILSMRRSLQIQERLKSGDMRDTAVRRQHAKEIERSVLGNDAEFNAESLLARPH